MPARCFLCWTEVFYFCVRPSVGLVVSSCANASLFENVLPTAVFQGVYLRFSLKSLTGFKIESLIHLELISLYKAKYKNLILFSCK